MNATSVVASGRAVIALTCVLAACHSTPRTGGVAAAIGREIGDTSAFGVRILRVDRALSSARYSLTSPAHVVFLSVVPGRSIEPLVVPQAGSPMRDVGTHTAAVSYGKAPGFSFHDATVVEREEFDRCVADYVRARSRPAPRTVVRDSTGRAVEGPPGPRVPEHGDVFQAEEACARKMARREKAPEPAERDRHLVVLASRAALDARQIDERLGTITVTAPDVASTIGAIADALYVEHGAAWSGYYVRW